MGVLSKFWNRLTGGGSAVIAIAISFVMITSMMPIPALAYAVETSASEVTANAPPEDFENQPAIDLGEVDTQDAPTQSSDTPTADDIDLGTYSQSTSAQQEEQISTLSLDASRQYDDVQGNTITGSCQIAENGTYYLSPDAYGEIVIYEDVKSVEIVGNGAQMSVDGTMISAPNHVTIDASQTPGVSITLRDVYIKNDDSNPQGTPYTHMIDFSGKGNQLNFEGTCVLDHSLGAQEKAGVHVNQDTSLRVGGSGTLYFYKYEQGAGFGGATFDFNGYNYGEPNGEIIFDRTGLTFMKGSKQGALIGAGCRANSGLVPGSVKFLRGEYYLVSVSRGAVIGGSAGSSGASSGTEVYVSDNVSMSIWVDYSGAAIGGGGYSGGQDATGGTLHIDGASIRPFCTANSAANVGWNGQTISQGVNDAVITARRVNGDGEAVYPFAFDTKKLSSGADSFSVMLDGDDFFTGGLHKYTYVNEALLKSDQYKITDTPSNFVRMTPENQDSNLYFYATAGDHELVVNDEVFDLVWDEQTSTLKVDYPDDEDQDGTDDEDQDEQNGFAIESSVTGNGEIEILTDGNEATRVDGGQELVIKPSAAEGSYLAQVRWALIDEEKSESTEEAAEIDLVQNEDLAQALSILISDASSVILEEEFDTVAQSDIALNGQSDQVEDSDGLAEDEDLPVARNYKALQPNEDGTYALMMPQGDISIVADFIPVVWDGTIDLTWYDDSAPTYNLTYPAQFAGLALIVNGIFNNTPLTEGQTTSGESVGIPDVDKQFKMMGAVFEGEGVDREIKSSNLYGEFTSTYGLWDSQNDYEFIDGIESIMRVVGDPSYVKTRINGSVSTGALNQVTSSTYYDTNKNFHDKTVNIVADMDFGAVKGADGKYSPSSPIFMSLGGQYCTIPGNSYSLLGSSWCGVLDGCGHSFTNVYSERYIGGSSYGDSQSNGIIGRLGVHDNELNSPDPDKWSASMTPTVRQLVLESGMISARRSTGGIVGKIGKTPNGAIVEYCINKASVSGTDKKGTGGIVGASWNGGLVRYCANFGNISSVVNGGTGFMSGGIVGSNECTVQNCYNVGLVEAATDSNAMGIGTNNGGAYAYNCPWLSTKSVGGGYYISSYRTRGTVMGAPAFGEGTDIPVLTAEIMNRNQTKLGSYVRSGTAYVLQGEAFEPGPSIWKNDSSGVNSLDGVNYPVLFFQDSEWNANDMLNITVEQPAIGGTISASAEKASFGQTIKLSSEAVPGYTLEYYIVNGEQLASGVDSFLLTGDTTIAAQFRELNTTTITFQDTFDQDFTFTAVKDGYINALGSLKKVEGYPVKSGDKLYENDVLTFSYSTKENARPSDIDKEYHEGGTWYATLYYNSSSFTGSATSLNTSKPTYTVRATDGDLSIKFTAPTAFAKAWSYLADIDWYSQDNTEFTISTPNELAGLASLVNDGVTFANSTIKLGNNISLVNNDGILDESGNPGRRIWDTAIGSTSNRLFQGNFDGCGYSITGLDAQTSLFGYISGSQISNLTVSGSLITTASYGTGLGVFAQSVTNTDFANCINKVNVSTSSKVGGFVGQAKTSTFINCVNEGDIVQTSKYNDAAGFAGGATAGVQFVNCTNKGAIENAASAYTAGFVGSISSSPDGVKFERCANVADITSGGSAVGFVGGMACDISITESYNTGNMLAHTTSEWDEACASGFIGYLNMNLYTLSMRDCYTNSRIEAKSDLYNAIASGIVTKGLKATINTENVYVAGELIANAPEGQTAKKTAFLNTESYGALGVVEANSFFEAQDGLEANYLRAGSSVTSEAQGKSRDELKGMAATLGEAWKADAAGEYAINDGLPVLSFQSLPAPAAPDHAIAASVTGAGQIEVASEGSIIEGANAGDALVITATPDEGSYLAQIRWAKVDNAAASSSEDDQNENAIGVPQAYDYKALEANEDGVYTLEMPSSDISIVADFIPIVWDGTMDVTWYDPSEDAFTLNYAAQFEGLAAIVNGIFNAYPVKDNGAPDIDAFKAACGLVENVDGETSNHTSNLYAELTNSYAGLSTSMRFVGDPAFIQTNFGSGSTGSMNQTTTDDYYYGGDTFAFKTVYIGSDLDFGALQNEDGTWSASSPLYMSLGGQYPMVPEDPYAKISASWNGTLDGLGHKFCNVFGERRFSVSFGDAECNGIVGRLGEHDSDVDKVPVGSTPTVRRIIFESGSINGARMVGGIVGGIRQTDTGAVIEYCINKATVKGTDSKGTGGIVGAGWNKGVVRGCANFGTVTNAGKIVGGISGSNEVSIISCYNVGSIVGTKKYAMAIGTNNGGGSDIRDCYWLTGSAAGGGYYGTGSANAIEFGPNKTIETLTAELLNASNGGIWKNDSTGVNSLNGVSYPVLFFQDASYDPEKIFNITVENPEKGKVSVDKTQASYGDLIRLSVECDTGYVLDKFVVNGEPISDSSFVADRDCTVSANLRAVNEIPFTIEDTSDKHYTITATKSGVIPNGDGTYRSVENFAIDTGDKVYENDRITFLVEMKEGAYPDDLDKCYTGAYSLRVAYSAQTPTYSRSLGGSLGSTVSYTVPSTDTNASAFINNGLLTTTAKNWIQLADTSFYDADNPKSSYTISTAEQLAGVSKLSAEGVTFEGITLTLANDISMANPDGTTGRRIWDKGIGATTEFKGVFEGDSKSITDLDGTAPLFKKTNGAKIRNLIVDVNLSGASDLAAIVGTANQTSITGCTSRGSIEATGGTTAGIVSISQYAVVSDCVNEASVTNKGTVAGIIGGSYGSSDINVSNCVNKGSIKTTSSTCGGILASAMGNVEMSDCSNLGSVSAEGTSFDVFAGGLGGLFNGTAKTVKISRCYNAGTVSAVINGGAYARYITAGGLVAKALGAEFVISDCYNVGAVSARADVESSRYDAWTLAGAIVAMGGAAVKTQNVYTTVVPSAYSIKFSSAAAIVAGGGTATTLINASETNTYYLGSGDLAANGANVTCEPCAQAKESSSMKDAEFVDTLNAGRDESSSAWKADESGDTNNGYPLLGYQNMIFIPKPVITAQPVSTSTKVGHEVVVSVDATASVGDESELSYQWYVAAGSDMAGRVAVDGATAAQWKNTPTEVSDYYVQCDITLGDITVSTEPVKVEVLDLDPATIVYVDGNGTEHSIEVAAGSIYVVDGTFKIAGDGEQITLDAPKADPAPGYSTVGWKLIVSKDAEGNDKYDFDVDFGNPVDYTITYNDIDAAQFESPNPDTYSLLTSDFTLCNPTKNGYHFVGWLDKNGKGSQQVSISRGSTGDLEFTAVWAPDFSFVTVKVGDGRIQYNGDAQEPNVEVKTLDGMLLEQGIDYTLQFVNNTSVGTASVTITPIDVKCGDFALGQSAISIPFQISAPRIMDPATGIAVESTLIADVAKTGSHIELSVTPVTGSDYQDLTMRFNLQDYRLGNVYTIRLLVVNDAGEVIEEKSILDPTQKATVYVPEIGVGGDVQARIVYVFNGNLYAKQMGGFANFKQDGLGASFDTEELGRIAFFVYDPSVAPSDVTQPSAGTNGDNIGNGASRPTTQPASGNNNTSGSTARYSSDDGTQVEDNASQDTQTDQDIDRYSNDEDEIDLGKVDKGEWLDEEENPLAGQSAHVQYVLWWWPIVAAILLVAAAIAMILLFKRNKKREEKELESL